MDLTLKMSEVEVVVVMEMTMMTNKGKKKLEENLIKSLKHSWNPVNSLLDTSSNSKLQTDKLVFMEILLTITAYFNQQQTV